MRCSGMGRDPYSSKGEKLCTDQMWINCKTKQNKTCIYLLPCQVTTNHQTTNWAQVSVKLLNNNLKIQGVAYFK